MAKQDIIKQFIALKGVGAAKAELLYKNGFDSLEKLKKASVKDLAKLDGLNETFAKGLLAQLKEKKPAEAKNSTSQKTTKPKAKTTKQPPKPKEAIKKPSEKKEIKSPSPSPKKEGEKEEPETVEEEGYKVKIKPELSKELQEKLRTRKSIKKRTPKFLREEWFRYKRIPKNWRRPDGITSKMRINLNYRPSKVRVGFRGPKEARGLHASGFKEIFVINPKDLEAINPKTQAARVGSTVGTKKRMDIEKKAEELNIRILNM